MDPMGLAAMLFVLVLFAMIGGFVLLFPISRRLGALLEQKVAGKLGDGDAAMELRRLEATVRSLQEEVERISDQQAFTESLLAEREPLLVAEKAETRSVSPS